MSSLTTDEILNKLTTDEKHTIIIPKDDDAYYHLKHKKAKEVLQWMTQQH